MIKIKVFIAVGFFVLVSVKLFAGNTESVSISHGKYFDYYHIKYKLTKNNFSMAKNNIPNNGQFEIFLYKEKFPIPAKNCKGKLILRMPATLSDSKNIKESSQKKITLFNGIKKIYESGKGSVDIIIELNPYVITKSKNPLKLELENCNIFFRTIKNSYVDTL